MLGSVAAKVLHDMTVPVWTASHLEGTPVKCQAVLAAVDSTPEAETVIRAATALANSYGASLSLAYVLETPPVCPEAAYGNYRHDMVSIEKDLVAKLLANAGAAAPLQVLEGPVASAIAQEAKRTGAQLIVTGRGRAQEAVTRMWSHLYPIVRHAPCPVLSI